MINKIFYIHNTLWRIDHYVDWSNAWYATSVEGTSLRHLFTTEFLKEHKPVVGYNTPLWKAMNPGISNES